ncbi:hypothetical protein OPV22_025341 [Ensete ventricosum]|uniref:Malectin-like domain-containing protein n=1 Tax=Ensete ventricosum TaxID=4639 RepID=A0AAV8QCD3_ENSVE|nr:hypothetical protein OPV22_025341 [Ensete ventricosum]
MDMVLFFLLWSVWWTAILSHCQLGFINIDCGYAANTSYINNLTGMEDVSDAEYIDTSLPVRNLNASLDRSHGQ